MNKYELWDKRFTEYIENVSTEQLIEDSRKAGIILVLVSDKEM